jgi:hypothetical protein
MACRTAENFRRRFIRRDFFKRHSGRCNPAFAAELDRHGARGGRGRQVGRASCKKRIKTAGIYPGIECRHV